MCKNKTSWISSESAGEGEEGWAHLLFVWAYVTVEQEDEPQEFPKSTNLNNRKEFMVKTKKRKVTLVRSDRS